MKDFTDVLAISQKRAMPINGFVYILFDAEGKVLYVGKTVQTLAQRMDQHRNTNPGMFHAAVKLEAEELPVHMLDEYEANQIHAYHPPGNRLCPGCNDSGYERTRRKLGTDVKQISDSDFAVIVHRIIADAKSAGRDRISSDDLLAQVNYLAPDAGLKPGQIRQKVKAVIGHPSTAIYIPALGKSVRGWYLHDIRNVVQHT